MDEIKLDEDNSIKEEEDNIKDGLDDIFRMKSTKTISCAEEEECNKFQSYISHQSD